MARTFDSPRRDALRKVAIRVRVKPSVKVMAEQLAQKEGRSIADWLERLKDRERHPYETTTGRQRAAL